MDNIKYLQKTEQIADQFPKFQDNEILDWINYVQQEMNKILKVEKSHKKLTDQLIECTEIFKFLENNKLDDIKIEDNKLDDIKIILKSKKTLDAVEINDSVHLFRTIKFLRRLTINPFTCVHKKDDSTGKIKMDISKGKGHTYPARKKGKQEGRSEYYLKQKLARDLYLIYKRRYIKVGGVQLFIQAVFSAAGFTTSIESFKKYLDYKTWMYKVIFSK
jgi:hypothetical protein